jgi:hypothetical protein
MAKTAREHHAELRGAYIRAQHDLVGNDKWSVKDEDNLDQLEDIIKGMVVDKAQPKTFASLRAPSPSELGSRAVADALTPSTRSTGAA